MPRFDVLTLHPEMVTPFLTCSILGRAVDAKAIEIGVIDIRDHAQDRHRSVDAAPYGGGPGMVMRVDVVARAVEAAKGSTGHVVHLTPAGRPFNQRVAEELSGHPHLVFLCGHYEGIDARIESVVDDEISLGDFVLTGGEIAAVAVVDAVARLHPGVLGNAESAQDESFTSHLLEHPHYTRPRSWRGFEVPEVLCSGHHGRVKSWRKEASIQRTRARRPELLNLRSSEDVDEEPHEQ
jgi:tRNA (guanine37-N1)-methyltransferase